MDESDDWFKSIGFIRFSDSVDEAFVRRIEAAGRALSAEGPTEHVVVTGHGTTIALLLNTCAQGLAKTPEVEGVEFHVKNDNTLRIGVAVVTAEQAGRAPRTRIVHDTPGLDDQQNEVYGQLVTDGIDPERAADISGLV